MVEQDLTHILQQRLRFSKKTPPAQAAVLIAITKEPNPQVLLTRRSLQLSNHAGEVSFPGGKRDPADTSNIVVALREAQEEIALNPFDVELIGELPMQHAKTGMQVKPIVGFIPPQTKLIAQPTEIDRIFFVSLAELLHTPVKPYEVQYAKQALYFPSLQVNNEVIWGLTARMIISLFDYGLDYQKDWPFLLNAPNFKRIRR